MPHTQKKKLAKKIFSTRNKVQVVLGGTPFFTLLNQQIAAAKHSIHLQTYILVADSTGNEVAQSLMQVAQRGVGVYLMADGFASRNLPQPFIDRLQAAGVCFRFFEPVFRSEHFYFGRRLHHKVAVFDNRFALVSGSNIADRYNDLPDQKAWLDMALFVEGDASVELYDICCKIWEKDKSQKNLLRRKLVDLFQYISKEEEVGVRVLQNDWVRRKQEIYYSYHKLFKEARSSITIVCSYFLPGLSLRKRLSRAARRGVEVRVVLSGRSDVAFTKNAERFLYRWMLRHNIHIYEYQPSVLHAKVAVVDNELLTIGSYNINDLSAQASVELNLLVKDKVLAQQVADDVSAIINNQCIGIDSKWLKTPFFSLRQFRQFLSFHAFRLLVTLGTFYFKRE